MDFFGFDDAPGSANFFIGLGSRASDGLMMNWFLNIFMAILCLIYIIYNNGITKLFKDAKKYKKPLIGMCVFDNMAWIGFAIALTLAPIGITVALSESYIIVAVLLGMIVGKERLHHHQKIGLVLAVISAISLAAIS